jgi:hypothetical protein
MFTFPLSIRTKPGNNLNQRVIFKIWLGKAIAYDVVVE